MNGLPPGLAGYLAAVNQNQQAQGAEVQQAVQVQGLRAQLQKAAQEERFRASMAGAGGDIEKALSVALSTGNVEAAHQLAPLVKMQQEARQREETPKLLAQIMGQDAPGASAGATEVGVGQPVSVAGVAPQQPADPTAARQARVAELRKMSLIPQVANNPVAMQRLQAEIDRLSTVRPMIEHNFSVGNEQVQPHISHDEGRSWQPIPGSQPSAKFAKQIASATPGREPVVMVRTADGKVVWKKASEAEGQEVGSRQTDANITKQVQQLGRDFEKAGLPQMIPVVERAMQITPEQAKFLTGPGAVLPDASLPQDVREARQALSKLFNITLKDRSGMAVTYQELERLKQEFGSGLLKKPEQLLSAIREARSIVESHYTGISASHGKDALDKYNENLEAIGGTAFKVGGRTVKLTPTQPGGPQAPAGPYPDADKESRYQEWKRRNGK